VTYRFLFDECLWPDLVRLAHEAGHWDSTCVRDRGLSGTKDHKLIRYVVEGDYTLVTHNAVDFRGPEDGPVGGLHACEPIHAGLVCLVSEHAMTPDRQKRLFGYALTELAAMPDLINQALEVKEDLNGEVRINIYRIPE